MAHLFSKAKICLAAGSAALALLILITPGKVVSAAGGVPVDEAHFPDKNFRSYITKNIDKDSDGKLSEEEIANTTYISVSKMNIKSLDGVECFTAITSLTCDGNELTKIDVSKNTLLRSLDCQNNKIDSLVLGNNKELWQLKAYNNKLTDIDLSANTDLGQLYISRNQIRQIDLSNNKKLTVLELGYNKLVSLDLTGVTDLGIASINNNKLSELDIDSLTQLSDLDVSHNNLTTIDTSTNKALSKLNVNYNKLTSLDISGNGNLSFLYADSNDLTDVKLSKDIFGIFVNNNKLTSLDVKVCEKLYSIECGHNQLTSLDLSGNKKLRELSCIYNELTELDISGNTDEFARLYCYGNKIGTLDVSMNKFFVEGIEKGILTVGKTESGTSYFKYEYEKGNGDSGEYAHDIIAYDESTTVIDGTSGSVKLDKTSEEIVCGKSLLISASITGISGDVVWKSSDENVAKVSSSGNVTAKMAGTVTISAAVGTKKAACRVRVLYKDVTNKSEFWFTPTNELTEMGVVKGYDKQTKFKPANECTRAQMLTFIWRLKGSPEPDAQKCKFPDVKKSDYFYKPVIWAVENGITTGYSDGKFKPQNVCTRAQTVTFLWRLAGEPDPQADDCKFKDVKKSDYFYIPVIWASEQKIVAGYKDKTFRPQGKCLRRQMVTFLYKYYQNVGVGK
ncbi:MAG: S-layer homology domain-containing protein [Clostridiales bacterium]|nr:S-layer homology domain-containing protein [Clostridiales bacterium]